MSGLETAEYHWLDAADPRDAEFVASGEVRRRHGGLPSWHEQEFDAVYSVYDGSADRIGEVDVGLEQMPDADEQPVSRVYRVEGVDDEGEFTGLTWGAEVDEAWRAAREGRDQGNEHRGVVGLVETTLGRPDDGEYNVHLLDVGVGQSVLVDTGDAVMPCDGGPTATPGGKDPGPRTRCRKTSTSPSTSVSWHRSTRSRRRRRRSGAEDGKTARPPTGSRPLPTTERECRRRVRRVSARGERPKG